MTNTVTLPNVGDQVDVGMAFTMDGPKRDEWTGARLVVVAIHGQYANTTCDLAMDERDGWIVNIAATRLSVVRQAQYR